jgi:hypothetical protein
VTLRVGFDGRRVDDTDEMILSLQVSGERVAVSPSGFEAGRHPRDLLLVQPVGDEKPAGVLAKTRWRSLPPSRRRRALNLSLAMSSPSGGRFMIGSYD